MTKQHINKAGIDLIKKFEGFRPNAYTCSAGKLTIGYGHIIKEYETALKTKSITEEEAESLLKQDIGYWEAYVNMLICKYKLKPNNNQFSALVSFFYNTGSMHVDMMKRFARKELKSIGKSLEQYNKICDSKSCTTLQGLVNRRKAEQELYFNKCEQK